MGNRGGLLALAATLTMSCGAADGPGSTAAGASPGQVGDPACAPQDARLDGTFARSCCLEEPRWRWNGADCEVFWVVEQCYCSRCIGADCERLFESEQACHAAYAGCPATSP